MSTISRESFIAGFAYGGTTVMVGQPFETLKTLTQVHSTTSGSNAKPSLVATARDLYASGGIKAFYRGGVPLLLGGGLNRSACFGVYNRWELPSDFISLDFRSWNWCFGDAVFWADAQPLLLELVQSSCSCLYLSCWCHQYYFANWHVQFLILIANITLTLSVSSFLSLYSIRQTTIHTHNNTNSVVPTLESRYGPTPKSSYYLGCINPHVVLAGWAGGIGRGIVEGPFEMVKVRRQVVSGWAFADVFQGFGATLFRNSFLFSSFVIYMDILKQQVSQVTKWCDVLMIGLFD